MYPPYYEATIKERLLTVGITKALKEVRDYYLKEQTSELYKAMLEAEALIVASRTDISFYSDGDVIKYNTKKYTHVFGNSWMDLIIGWSNQKGFFINNVTNSNSAKLTTYLQAAYNAFNSHKGTLKHGEVYVCARFGNTWRGMKIVK